MYDSEVITVKFQPTEVVLNNIRRTMRVYEDTKEIKEAKEVDGVTKVESVLRLDPNETRRRMLMDIAAGRFAWLCREGEWRGVSHREMVESLVADVATFREAEEEHKAACVRGRKRRKLRNRIAEDTKRPFSFLRRQPSPPREIEIYTTAPYRSVAMIVDTVPQLERGLELLVERGYLRMIGEGDKRIYYVVDKFFEGLDLRLTPEPIYEP